MSAPIVPIHATLETTVAQGVAHVELDRPASLNSLTREVFEDLVEAGCALRERAEVRAVVLSGRGRAFSAGLDVSEFAGLAEATGPERGSAVVLGEQMGAARALAQQAVHVWSLVEVPVIAAVNGPALGGGMQIALGADLRIAHPDSRFALMETKWGIIPDMCGTQLLPRLVGQGMAKRLILTAETIDGTEAHRIGLVEELAEAPVERALELAADLAGRSRSALVHAKSLVDLAYRVPLADGLDAEQQALSELLGTEEQRSAVVAQLALLSSRGGRGERDRTADREH
ncbi:enoyl-CoA hydratase/carnithine racemase [Brevibacterium sanguinis]|uniref:Enoyl-CoA hydratase/carnithine racemase n=2 Tax=Brevibacterium TaxID=1696 RepID=A0A366ILE2_9MICO|nr:MULTISPECIES: enoyl-CoA hydratase-related protein [Brevibacterium]RBP67016.1 enoyl-CoA hydratase/carnithine racemase [Brevibacterium sanguinis]RBP73541.1 enoyl-CoA hydratase/carnithine racemase [Brevibacterium celere]